MSLAKRPDHKLALQLEQGLDQLALPLDNQARQRLLTFVALLTKWNRAFNLTAVREPEQMVPRHLLDSLVVQPWLAGGRIIDVGSGAGLPGIPLAIANPARSFMLLDSNSKKTRFITQAVGELSLANVEVMTARAEDYRPDIPFDTVITRAVAEIGTSLGQMGHLCGPGGRFLFMKGALPEAELAALPPGFVLDEVVPLAVPSLEGERNLVIISRLARNAGQ